MLVVTAAQMRAADRYTIDELGFTAELLMEEAGRLTADLCCNLLGDRHEPMPVSVWVGKGNNGGDGLVAARRLSWAGHRCRVFLVCEDPEVIEGAARENLGRVRRQGIEVERVWDAQSIAKAGRLAASSPLQIDALVGTGNRGPLEGPLGQAAEVINQIGALTVSIDIPSGVLPDTGEVSGPAVKADYTLALGRPKIGCVTYPGAHFCGKMSVADIGIPASAYPTDFPKIVFAQREDIIPLMPVWPQNIHKGDRGGVLIVGGSPGLTGAVALASRAALRIGAGLVTAGVPQKLHDIMEMKLTEVMTAPLPETGTGHLSLEALDLILTASRRCAALAVGPGLGRHEELAFLVEELVTKTSIPLVIDADGLNALVCRTEALRQARAPVILTPHAGEMARLAETTVAEVEAHRLPLARQKAQQWQACVVLKGARTVIAAPNGNVCVNSSGGSALATAGSGDVLTGIIAGLLAQGLPAEEAAMAGAYVHGMAAAEVTAITGGDIGIVAGDLIETLPRVRAALAGHSLGC